MATSDADKLRESIEKKRRALAEAQAQRRQAEFDRADELEVAQLAAEESRLDAAIKVAKNAAKISNVKAGNDANLDAAKQALEQSAKVAKAVSSPKSATADNEEK